VDSYLTSIPPTGGFTTNPLNRGSVDQWLPRKDDPGASRENVNSDERRQFRALLALLRNRPLD